MNSRTLCAGTAALGAGVILIAGCGGGGGSDFPTGTWTYTSRSLGVATADFRPDGTWEFTQGLRKDKNILTQVSSGLYSTTDEVLIFEADSRCEALHYGIEPGTYTWTLDGERLTLTPLHEPCVERRGDMGARSFSRVSKAT